MGDYSIKDIEQITGIKAHTIRIWEKRYSILEPNRNESNIRLYSDYELRKILNIAVLNKNGYKISSIARLNAYELESNANTLLKNQLSGCNVVDSLINYTLNFDEVGFTQKVEQLIESDSLEATFQNTLVPFLNRVGLDWQTNLLTPIHEHFATNAIRKILWSAINSLPIATKSSSIVFALPENEYHDIKLMFMCYTAKKQGFNTIYIGQSAPFSLLDKLLAKSNVIALYTYSYSSKNIEATAATLALLSKQFPSIKFLIVTPKSIELKVRVPENLYFIDSISDFLN